MYEAKRVSPLKEGEIVTALDLIPLEEGGNEFFVEIEWEERNMGVPLSQLEGIDVDDEVQQIIGDWHYWVKQGYEF